MAGVSVIHVVVFFYNIAFFIESVAETGKLVNKADNELSYVKHIALDEALESTDIEIAGDIQVEDIVSASELTDKVENIPDYLEIAVCS